MQHKDELENPFTAQEINDNDFVISFTANTTEGDVDIGGVNISV